MINSVTRLTALLEILKTVPQEKMKTLKQFEVQWQFIGGEFLPVLKMEFHDPPPLANS